MIILVLHTPARVNIGLSSLMGFIVSLSKPDPLLLNAFCKVMHGMTPFWTPYSKPVAALMATLTMSATRVLLCNE